MSGSVEWLPSSTIHKYKKCMEKSDPEHVSYIQLWMNLSFDGHSLRNSTFIFNQQESNVLINWYLLLDGENSFVDKHCHLGQYTIDYFFSLFVSCFVFFHVSSYLHVFSHFISPFKQWSQIEIYLHKSRAPHLSKEI